MDEYVKRAAIMEFPIRKDHCDKERANEHFIFGIESVLEYVENLPAADVAPVVHCRHCRSYNKPRLGWCSVHMDREGPDDFCGYGVRKDDDDAKAD